ncbi:hypothetical protein L3X38_041744 [Prunus dulcis]|uniref:F-box domain-containing protein n=1 Tax=Prunus dulcis TaxID=3755 RepID=A0AAD4UVA8_PRUDU|nr:hypothetical protein L3X38_041744 [Prunus dulcis]
MDDIQEGITKRMQELKSEAMTHCFPREIIHEILFRLPVKSVINCTSVCKSWRSMIMNKSFIRSYLSPINNLNDSHLFLIHRVAGREGCIMLHRAIVHDVIEECIMITRLSRSTPR